MVGFSRSILVLEDQPLVALDIEQTLLDAGFDDVTVISSCAGAEAWLQAHRPDLAVIDVHLRDGVCSTAAQILVDNHVPFLVHSALMTEDADEGAIFRRGIWIGKPALPDQLISTVKEVME